MLKFLSEESGAASAEYALIIVMIGLGLGVAVWGMAESVARSVGWAGAQIAQAAGVASTPTPMASVTEPSGPAAGAAGRSAAAKSNGKAKGKPAGGKP